MLRSLFVILSGNAANSLLFLVRNLLVARMISIEDYGIAATFTLALAIIEMTSTFGIQQMLVQDRRGEDPDFQAALQGFQMLRGLANAGILFLLAGTFADFLGVPEVAWAHRLITVVLVLNGLVHMDVQRLSRQMRFGAMAMASALSPVAALAVLPPLYWLFGDYRVMLWSLVVQAAATTALSHLFAERPYRIRFDLGVIREGMAFGWPLLVDGLLLFLIFNGEKFIVGRELGMEPLALFSMAVTLTLTPGLILQKSVSSLFLPRLSSAQPEAFRRLSGATIETHLAAAGFLLLGVVFCADPFVHLVLGAKYAGILPLMTILAVMQGVRLLKGGCAIVSIARGYTSNSMASNLVRVAALVPAWYLTAQGAGLVTLIWVGILGELFSLVVSFWLLRRWVGQSLRPVLLPLLLTLGLFALAGLWAAEPPDHPALLALLPLLWLGICALLPELRLRGGALLHRRLSR